MMSSNMENNITFSIIVPAKNEEKYIDKCIKGINSLDFDKNQIEIIVVDNGSKDQTKNIAGNLGAKVIEIRDGTIGELRNQGAKVAKGDILAFIDADCIPQKNWLKNALPHFANPSVACVGSKPMLPENGTTWIEQTWSIIKYKTKKDEVKWLSSCNFIVRKKVFEKVNGFETSLVTCEDADIGYRISSKWMIINDPSVSIVHLREPKTLVDFIKKEVWHGVGNYKGLLKHGIIIQELPSLLMPIWTMIWGILLFISIIFYSKVTIMFCIISFLLPSICQTFRVLLRTKAISRSLQILFLYIVYYLSRAIAIFQITGR